MRALPPLVLALSLALALPPAHGQPPTVAHLQWSYRFSLPDPASANVHVDVSIAGGAGAITDVSFAPFQHRQVVSNVTCGALSPLCYCPPTARNAAASGGDDPYTRARCFPSSNADPSPTPNDLIAIHVHGTESFAYDVLAERVAFNDATQRLEHVGADFALFKAESLTLEYSYSYYQGVTFENATSVELAPPQGWQAAGPWNESGTPLHYDMEPGTTLPRGYVAMGHFHSDITTPIAGKSVRYVRMGNVSSFEQTIDDYLAKATPYYTAVYGPGVHEHILIVNAPDPMFHGGLGGADSFFVHEKSDLRTVAHEYAHVYQLFASDETAGESTIWLNEGDADYHSALSLYAADVWTPQRVNDFFQTAANDATDPALGNAKLPDAVYGSPLEQFAYHKGLIVLRALDVKMRDDSGGKLGVSDVLRALNVAHGDPTSKGSAQPVTNDEVRSVAESLLGEDLTTFFAENVTGPDWPTPRYAPFVPDGQLATTELDVTPPRAQEGEPLVVDANVTNRGTQRVVKAVDLYMDDARVATQNVSLDVGASATLRFQLLAGAPGDHDARVLATHASYHSQTPPNVAIDHATFTPAAPRVGQDATLLVFLKNLGESAGTARVEAQLGNATLAASTQTIVDGSSGATVTLPVRFATAGGQNVTLLLVTPQGNATRNVTVGVLSTDAPTPRSSDGEVPAANGDGAKGVPAGGWVAVSALAVAAAGWRRRAT